MNRTTNILLLTVTLLMTGCGGHHYPDVPELPAQSELRPIRFGISADLDVDSKAVIDDENVTQQTFVALGNLTVDGAQQTDLFGESGTEVVYVSGAWTYSPLRYWQPGVYDFAGVMPSGVGTASFSGDNQLTLDFGTTGFNLAADQHDLMVAFTSKEVAKVSEATDDVLLNFSHQLALLNIEVQIDDSPMSIVINNIKIYGNHKVATDATFTNGSETITSEWTLGSTTTETGYYHQVDASNKIESLLVFPEQSVELTVAVNYTESYGGSFTKTKYGTIRNLNWQAGKIYTYKTNLTSESIVFEEPIVTDWSNGGRADEIPPM